MPYLNAGSDRNVFIIQVITNSEYNVLFIANITEHGVCVINIRYEKFSVFAPPKANNTHYFSDSGFAMQQQ